MTKKRVHVWRIKIPQGELVCNVSTSALKSPILSPVKVPKSLCCHWNQSGFLGRFKDAVPS
jgi:hypothetical protein